MNSLSFYLSLLSARIIVRYPLRKSMKKMVFLHLEPVMGDVVMQTPGMSATILRGSNYFLLAALATVPSNPPQSHLDTYT